MHINMHNAKQVLISKLFFFNKVKCINAEHIVEPHVMFLKSQQMVTVDYML